jgi:curved DNA-binding protein CbpA
MTDPYLVLGVSPAATQAEITRAYRRQLRDQHPDMRCAEANSEADERLREILAAYALLRDPDSRGAHDRTRPTPTDSGPIRITVTHVDSTDEQPLWAGPVHWHR